MRMPPHGGGDGMDSMSSRRGERRSSVEVREWSALLNGVSALEGEGVRGRRTRHVLLLAVSFEMGQLGVQVRAQVALLCRCERQRWCWRFCCCHGRWSDERSWIKWRPVMPSLAAVADGLARARESNRW